MTETQSEEARELTVALTPPQLAGVLAVVILIVVLLRRRRSKD